MHMGGDTALQKLHEATAELGCVCMRSLFCAIGVTGRDSLDHRGMVDSDVPHAFWLKHFVFEMDVQHAPAFIK